MNIKKYLVVLPFLASCSGSGKVNQGPEGQGSQKLSKDNVNRKNTNNYNSVFKSIENLKEQFKKSENFSVIEEWLNKHEKDIDGPYFCAAVELKFPELISFICIRFNNPGINKRQTINYGCYSNRLAPLHIAARNGYNEIAKFLLQLGAKVDVKDSAGNTPLHYASIEGHVETVKLLMENKANVNIENDCGCTPLYNAVSERYLEIAKLLVGKV